MPTPGLLYVRCSITDPALPDDAYNRWYNEVHIPEVLRLHHPTPPRTVLRYRNRDVNHRWRYLNLLPPSRRRRLDRQSAPPDGDILPTPAASSDGCSAAKGGNRNRRSA